MKFSDTLFVREMIPRDDESDLEGKDVKEDTDNEVAGTADSQFEFEDYETPLIQEEGKTYKITNLVVSNSMYKLTYTSASIKFILYRCLFPEMLPDVKRERYYGYHLDLRFSEGYFKYYFGRCEKDTCLLWKHEVRKISILNF